MLRYKFKVAANNTWEELDFGDNMCIDSEGTFISGKTYNNSVLDGDVVKVAIFQDEQYEFIPSQWTDYVFHAKRVKEQGYVELNKTFPIETSKIGDNDWYSFRFVNGQYYVWKKNETLDLGLSWATYKGIIGDEDKSVEITIKYYVYDGVLAVNGKDYEVDYSSLKWSVDEGRFIASNDEYLQVNIDGNEINIHDGFSSSWKDAVLFTISREENAKLVFDKIACANKTYTYPLDEESLLVFDSIYSPITYDDLKYRVDVTSGVPYVQYLSSVTKVEDDETVTEGTWVNLDDFDGERFASEYKDASYGNYINLYVKDVMHAISVGDRIMAKSINAVGGNLEVFLFSSTTSIDKFYAVINGKRYESTSRQTPYIEYNGSLIPLHKNYNSSITSSLTYGKEYFYYTQENADPIFTSVTPNNHYTIDVDGTKYPVISASTILTTYPFSSTSTDQVTYDMDMEYAYIPYDKALQFELNVVEVRSNNAITCEVVGDETNGIAKMLSVNPFSYTWELVLPMLPKWMYEKPSFYYTRLGKPFKQLHVFTPSQLAVPISLENSVSQNLTQSELIDTYFTNVELEKKVNRIVDMEKDIYYPAYIKDGKFQFLNGIKYHLHFRKRDNDWKVIEDEGWNQSSEKTGDLLGYLGFSNNDVFYQKKKLSKSFLRMSYFDTNDVKNQSLLYTATSFLDKNGLYKRYIDNSQPNPSVTWSNTTNSQHYISVDLEPSDGDKNKRLDCSFYMQNQYECTISSEGFYLYLFRDFAQPHRPRRIYLRTNFSHAGYGQTLTFTCPFGDSDKCVFPNDKICVCGNNVELKQIMPQSINEEGIKLNKIYTATHLPLNVMYCEELGQYIYYFDEEFTNSPIDENGVLHIDLYELKIKDESIVKA